MVSETELAPHRIKGKIPQKIKAQVVGMTTVVLENGDVIVVQALMSNVVRCLGEKDQQGRQKYEFELSYAVGRPEAATGNGEDA